MRLACCLGFVGTFVLAAGVSGIPRVSRAALVHRYSFNDGTARDSVGGADGVPVRGASFANGQVVFDPAVNTGSNTNPATGQYVDLPNGIAKFRNLTLEVWFTWRGGNAWQRVVDFGNITTKAEITPTDTTTGYSGQGFIIITPRNAPGNLLAQISINSHGDPSDTDFSFMTTPLSTNVEHHVVFTHSPDTGQERLYLDGALVGQDVATVDPSTTTYLNYWLGRSNFQADPFFNGSINEFRIYDNALTPGAVQFNFARGANGAIAIPEPAGATAALALGGALLLRRRCGRRR
jgi:hypothetical protein